MIEMKKNDQNGCGITINGKWLTGAAKLDDILQLYDIDRMCLSPAVQYYAQIPELWVIEFN